MKIAITLFTMVILGFINRTQAQVKVGDNPTNVNANSLLELESTTKGLLLPRMSNQQIAAMSGVPNGMLVFSTTDSALYLRRDTGWAILALKEPAPAPAWTANGDDIYNTNVGKVGIGTSTPYSQLSNTTGNTIGSDGQGGNPGSLSWAASQEGYVGQIYNDGTLSTSQGLVVKVRAQNALALDVSKGQQGGAATPLLCVRSSGNVGIGTSTPNATAQLELSSTTKGLLIPRLSVIQRNSILAPVNGLLIYQTDATAGFHYYDGSAWVRMVSGSTPAKIISGYIDPNNILGTGITVLRLANDRYTVSWAAGTFPSVAIPMVSTFAGTIALTNWGASANGSGSFTTSTSASTIWFTISEIR